MLSAIFDIFLMLEEGERNSSCTTEKHFKFLYRAASWCFQSFFTQLFCISNPASLRDTFPVRPWQLWEWRGEGAVGPLVSAAQGRGTKGRKIGVDKESECQNTEICRGKHTHKNWMLEWGCKLRFMHFFHNFIWSVCLIADKIQISDSTRSVYLTMTLEQLNVAQTLQMFPYFITELCFSVMFRVRSHTCSSISSKNVHDKNYLGTCGFFYTVHFVFPGIWSLKAWPVLCLQTLKYLLCSLEAGTWIMWQVVLKDI